MCMFDSFCDMLCLWFLALNASLWKLHNSITYPDCNVPDIRHYIMSTIERVNLSNWRVHHLFLMCLEYCFINWSWDIITSVLCVDETSFIPGIRHFCIVLSEKHYYIHARSHCQNRISDVRETLRCSLSRKHPSTHLHYRRTVPLCWHHS